MTFLDEEITFDIGHLVLLLALIGFIVFVSSRCSFSCSSTEGLNVSGVDVQPVHYKSCRCPDCLQVALEQARSGQLFGCNPNNPYVPYSKEECNYQYRKAALHGCGVA